MLYTKTRVLSWIFILALIFNIKAQVVTSGSETIVNTTTINSQQFPSVGTDSTGKFTVVWESFDDTNKDWTINRQMYLSDGTANGAESTLFSVDETDYRYPSIAVDKFGIQHIVYMVKEGIDDWNAYWRTYDATGTALTSIYRITSSSIDNQKFPDIGVASDGSYSVAVCSDFDGETSSNVVFRQKNSSYAATSASTQVNTTSGNFALYPKVSVHTDGNFVVVWQYDNGNATDKSDIYGQIYDNSMTKVGTEFVVNTTTAGKQLEPDVAYNDDGTFMVVWTSQDQDGSGQGVYRQRFSATGAVLGSETLVNTTTTNFQNHASISATFDGYYNITWSSVAQDGNKTGVYYQALKGDGTVLISEEKVNTRTTDFQHFSEVAQAKHDSLAVIVWQDGLRNSASSHDGDDYGVYFQQIENVDTLDPVANCKNVTVYLNANGYALIDSADVDGGSSDNYGFFTVSLDKDSMICNDLGNSVGIMTVTDLAGNTSSCSYAIAVEDTISPTLIIQDITVYLDGTGNVSVSSTDLVSSSSDNCSVSSVIASDTVYDCTQVGVFKVEVVATDPSGNTSSDSATVTVGLDGSQAANIWGGNTDTDWNTGSNWSCGRVPLAEDNVLISDVTNDPIIDESSSSPAVCRNLEIASGGVLTINPTKAMTVSGTVENNGTFTLESDASGTATLLTESTITGSGTFNVEQYFTGSGNTTPNGRRWYAGSPLVTSTSAIVNAAGNNRIWSHDEASGYSEITNNSTSLNSAQGYVLRLGANETLNFTGAAFNTGDVTNNSLDRTGTTFSNRGYNLLSNPYPSFVSWTDISRTNLSETMWIRTYNGSVMVFDTYSSLTDIGTNNSGDGDLTEEIAPMQAFWTLVSSDGQTGGITFDNASRSHNSGIQLRSGSNKQLIRVKLSDAGITDELVINFNDNALTTFEQYDSKKFYSGTLSELSCVVESEDLVINSLPIADSIAVPVKVTLIKSGGFSFLATGFEGMDDYDVFIEDKSLQSITPFNDGAIYPFTANQGEITNRFELVFKSKGLSVGIETVESDVIIFGFENNINITLTNLVDARVKVYNTTGKLLSTQSLSQENTTLPTDLPVGIYFIEVINNGKSTTQKIKL